MTDRPLSAQRYESLARNLEALASPTRLELLHALRSPQALHEIHVLPTLLREGETPDRALSRQAVSRHLDTLQEIGLVRRIGGEERARGDEYVLNHERLFAVVDEIRSLSKLRPVPGATTEVGETINRGAAGEPRIPDGPRLLVAYGRDDGIAYPLKGPPGTRWRIGRAAGCEIRLDYDPYISSENSAIERTAAGYVLHDLSSRNGTSVNWTRLPSGGRRALERGDLVTAGRSVLVFQEPKAE